MKNSQINFRFKIIQYLLGILFLFSGLTKAMTIDYFANSLIQVGSIWLGYLAPFITGLEIFLGLGLIFGIFLKLFSKVSFYFLIFLSIFLLYSFFYLDNYDCACFGEFFKLHPLVSLGKNIFLIIISFLIWKSDVNIYKRNYFSISLLFSSVIFIINFFEVHSLLRKDLKLHFINLENTFFNSFLSNGEQILFVFNPLCEPCKVESQKLSLYSNVIGIYSDNFTLEQIEEYKKIVAPQFQVYEVSSDSINKYLYSYPTIIHVKDKKVSKISHKFNP